jgi:AcrR family transcriptional regulator
MSDGLRCQSSAPPYRINEDIVSHSGISRATFYRNFHDKYDLMNYCFERYVSELDAGFEASRYVEQVTSIFSFIQQNRGFFINALKVDGDNSFRTYIYEKNKTFYFALMEKYYSDKDEQTKNTQAAFISAGIIQIAGDWLIHGAKTSPDKMALFCYECAPEKFGRIFSGALS